MAETEQCKDRSLIPSDTLEIERRRLQICHTHIRRRKRINSMTHETTNTRRKRLVYRAVVVNDSRTIDRRNETGLNSLLFPPPHVCYRISRLVTGRCHASSPRSHVVFSFDLSFTSISAIYQLLRHSVVWLRLASLH